MFFETWLLAFHLKSFYRSQDIQTFVLKIKLISNTIVKLISKFLTSQREKQIITMHLLLKVSNSNEIWSVDRIKHEKHFSRKIIQQIVRTFSKKSKLSISLYQLLLLYANWGLSKYTETELPITCFYLI